MWAWGRYPFKGWIWESEAQISKSWTYQNNHCPRARCKTNHKWWKGLARLDFSEHPNAFLSPTYMIPGQEETLVLIQCFSMTLPVGFEIDDGVDAVTQNISKQPLSSSTLQNQSQMMERSGTDWFAWTPNGFSEPYPHDPWTRGNAGADTMLFNGFAYRVWNWWWRWCRNTKLIKTTTVLEHAAKPITNDGKVWHELICLDTQRLFWALTTRSPDKRKRWCWYNAFQWLCLLDLKLMMVLMP